MSGHGRALPGRRVLPELVLCRLASELAPARASASSSRSPKVKQRPLRGREWRRAALVCTHHCVRIPEVLMRASLTRPIAPPPHREVKRHRSDSDAGGYHRTGQRALRASGDGARHRRRPRLSWGSTRGRRRAFREGVRLRRWARLSHQPSTNSNAKRVCGEREGTRGLRSYPKSTRQVRRPAGALRTFALDDLIGLGTFGHRWRPAPRVWAARTMLGLTSKPTTSAPWLTSQADRGPDPQPTSSTRFPMGSGRSWMTPGRSYKALNGLSSTSAA